MIVYIHQPVCFGKVVRYVFSFVWLWQSRFGDRTKGMLRHFESDERRVMTCTMYAILVRISTCPHTDEPERKVERNHQKNYNHIMTDDHSHNPLHRSTRLRSPISIQHRALTHILRFDKFDADLWILTVHS